MIMTQNIRRNWLRNQEFEVMTWAAQSPDLNPIENLWSYLKQRLLNDYDSPPSNLDVLWHRVQETWYSIPIDYCEKLTRSMGKRLDQVKKAKGLWTKY